MIPFHYAPNKKALVNHQLIGNLQGPTKRLYHLVSSLTKNPSHMQGTCKKSYYMLRRNATHGALFLQVSFWIRHSVLDSPIGLDVTREKIPINLLSAVIYLWKLVYHKLSTLLRIDDL